MLNNCSTTVDVPFLVQSCIRATSGELRPKTRITDTFLSAILCILNSTMPILFQCSNALKPWSSSHGDSEQFKSYNVLKDEALSLSTISHDGFKKANFFTVRQASVSLG